MTLSLLRNIHNAHLDFVKGREKYGLESNLKASLLSEKKIGLLGFGDLARSLYPLLLPFTKDINVYDPWISKKKNKQFGFNSMSLNQMFKKCEIIYVLAAVTTKNKNLIDKKLLNKMKPNSLFVLMSRAAVVNFKDLIKRVKKGDLLFATDVFPKEPVTKNDPIRKVKNVLFSAHRAGALESAFFNMGNIVLKDMNLISRNLQPKFCKIAQPKTVNLLASKPVAIN
jgi:phosphoglycerate dehydrogenase-like enzyme